MPQKDYSAIIQSILEKQYLLSGKLTELGAYQDKNYRLDLSGGKKFIVKISMLPEERDFVKAQTEVLLALTGDYYPKPIPTQKGEYQLDIILDDLQVTLRVLPFFEGKFLAEVDTDSSFLADFGKFLGRLNKEFAPLNNPILISQSHEWDLARFQESKNLASYISDPELRRVVLFFFMKYQEEVHPITHHLPKCLIHGDANDWNVLVQSPGSGVRGPGSRVLALIDFGDMVYSARINELGIALAYALAGVEDLISLTALFVKGYHNVYTLTERELSVLYYLIAARMCTSIVHAAKKSHEQPDSEYHQISAKPSQKLLLRWIRVNPFLFKEKMLSACNLPYTRKEIVEESTASKITSRKKFFSSNMSLSYDEPIEMLGSALQYMYSADGKTYLDCVNNIPHVGHCHPKVVEAGQKQMARLNTNSRYVYDSLNEYSKKLLSSFPDSLSKIFFVNSGSAATDLAVRLAKKHTGRDGFQVLEHAYHGNTSTAIALSPYKFDGKGGGGKGDGIQVLGLKAYGLGIKTPDSRLPRWNRGIPPAAFIAESVPGCAGQVLLDKEQMQDRVRWIRKHGGLYIADEVQTGFARVGKYFWGFELYDVVPDIVILGKPIANGHPMGAVVCSNEVAKSFETGMEFFSSFGGNPVSCEIAKTVLEVIEDEGLQANALEVGDFLLAELKSIKSPGILEVRGTGLFIGIEFVKNQKAEEPDPETASAIVAEMKNRGFLLSTDGPYENVIKFKPPMCFSKENAKELIKELTQILLTSRQTDN